MNIRFAHILSTVAPDENPSMEKVQELTFRTIGHALRSTKEHIPVEVLSASFSDRTDHLPSFVKPTRRLETSADSYPAFRSSRNFPLMREVLHCLKESEGATHYIYTNLDICLMPFFYEYVASLIQKGHDAIVINRRRISSRFLDEKDLDVLFAEAGETHTGYDCFVFEKKLLEQFILRDTFIGAPPAGNDLFYNLFTFAEAPMLLAEKHLTFHVGMELFKHWGDAELNRHNQSEFLLMLKELRPKASIAKFPGADLGFFKRHFKWLMNPTFHYPTMFSLDRKRAGIQKRSSKREVPGMKHRYLEWLIRKINFRDKV